MNLSSAATLGRVNWRKLWLTVVVVYVVNRGLAVVTIEISPAMWGITVDPHGNRIVATYKVGERAAWIQLVNCLAGRGISTVQTLGRPVPPPTIRVNVLSRYRQLECRSSG